MNRKNVWIFYPQSKCSMNEEAYRWICSEASAQGVNLRVLLVENISLGIFNSRLTISENGEQIDDRPDLAIVRGYDFVLMRHLELMGVRLLNSHDAMYNSLDKIITHQLLAKNSIPTPKTIYNASNYLSCCECFGSDVFIAKYAKGSKGNEVYMIKSQSDFDIVLNKYDEVVAQEYISTSFGKDIRVWVVGDSVVDAVMRYNDNDFKSNFSQGGSVKQVNISPEIERIALESCRAVGLKFAGVDLLFTEDSYTVCEVNGNAAFRSISTIKDENIIPARLFEYIFKYSIVR